MPRSEVQLNRFFSFENFVNIIMTDFLHNEIKIFSNTGEQIHGISNNMLPQDRMLYRPSRVAVNNTIGSL